MDKIYQITQQADQETREEVRREGSAQAELYYELADRSRPSFEAVQELYYLLSKSDSGAELEEMGIALPPDYFQKHKQKYLHKFYESIRMSKDEAVRNGVNPDIANLEHFINGKENELQFRKNYNNDIEEEKKKLEADEFSAKNLWLYIVFGILLCSGDLLMGEFLANQVLGLGATWWGGITLGIFGIALGVVMEIVLSMLYKSYKWLARTIMSSSLVFTIIMFVAMGVLRSSQFDMAISGTASFDKMSLMLFFVGMSLAAPTALGSVLFIIQKKWDWMRRKKELNLKQQHLGWLMNLVVQFREQWNEYEQILVSEFINGYVSRLSSIINPPAPEPQMQQASGGQQVVESGGDLVARMKKNVRQHYKFSMISLLLCVSLASCGNYVKGERQDKGIDISYILMPDQDTDQTALIKSQLPKEKVEAISIHLPSGSVASSFGGDKEVSLVASHYDERKTNQDLNAFIREVQNIRENGSEEYDLQLLGTLLHNASEQSNLEADQRKIVIYLNEGPKEILSLTDKEIQEQAKKDASMLKESRSLQLHNLIGAKANLLLEIEELQDSYPVAEVLRKNRLYFRRLLSSYQVFLDQVSEYNS